MGLFLANVIYPKKVPMFFIRLISFYFSCFAFKRNFRYK